MDRGKHATGTQLVRIARAQELLTSANNSLTHLLTPAELAQASTRENPAEYVAGHLAAKGAATDALDQLLPPGTTIDPLELETLDATSGAPTCTVRGRLAAVLAAHGMKPPRISITNEAGAALATAVAWAPATGSDNA
jgi:phosphopantetheinyl transferase (holo-ACP synthase)